MMTNGCWTLLRRIGLCAVLASFTATAMAKDSFFGLSAKSLTKKDVSFADYKGKTLLVVNIASECGYTPQLKGLQTLYQKYQDRNFAVLAFPSNDFRQEPLEGQKIEEFCRMNYGVKFPVFQKSHVVARSGQSMHPVYEYLTNNAVEKGPVKWNFEKFLVGPDGQIVGRFPSSVAPDNPKLIGAIENQLKS